MLTRIALLIVVSGHFIHGRAQHYSLDPVYGTNGIAYHDAPYNAKQALARSIELQPDGKLVGVFSIGTDSALVRRFYTDGSLDTDFGTAGSTLISANIPGYYYSLGGLALADDGGIYITGSRQANADDGTTIELIRLRSDGSFDTTFGSHGVSRYSVPNNSTCRTIDVQPNGMVLIAGNWGNGFYILRLEANGEIDGSFADEGIGHYSKPGAAIRASTLRVGANGGIHVVGHLSSGMDASGLMVAKVNGDGSLDTDYADGGFFIHDHTANSFRMEALMDCVPGPDGGLLAAGHIAMEVVKERFCAVKLRPDGSLDPDFGEGGMVIAGTADNERNMLANVILDPRGFYVLFGILTPPSPLYRSLFLRMDLAGNLIPDEYGEVFHQHQSADVSQYSRKAVLDNNGGLIFAVSYFNRPIGDHSLGHLVLSDPISMATTEHMAGTLRVWPNPTSEGISVSLDGPIGADASVLVTDAMGRMVQLSKSGIHWRSEHTMELDLPAGIANGTYALHITDALAKSVANFVVQR